MLVGRKGGDASSGDACPGGLDLAGEAGLAGVAPALGGGLDAGGRPRAAGVDRAAPRTALVALGLDVALEPVEVLLRLPVDHVEMVTGLFNETFRLVLEGQGDRGLSLAVRREVDSSGVGGALDRRPRDLL